MSNYYDTILLRVNIIFNPTYPDLMVLLVKLTRGCFEYWGYRCCNFAELCVGEEERLSLPTCNNLLCYNGGRCNWWGCSDIFYLSRSPVMSIAVGLVGIDGIVLATDSRVIEESEAYKTHHDYAKKLGGLSNSIGIM